MNGWPQAVTQRLAACRFPAPDTPLACAVSGGPDSLALVALARAAGHPVTAWHVDHVLRPDSAADGPWLAGVLRALDVDVEVVTVRVEPGPNLEARARDARYGALPRPVWVAHTADDLAETVLGNLVRGCGLDGLAPMRSRPGVWRPLLGLRRADTEAVCAAMGWEPRRDPMNDDPRFLRTRIRHEVVPLLGEVAGRDVVPLLVRLSALAGADADGLDALAAALDPTDCAALAVAPEALARRAVWRWLQAAAADDAGHPPAVADVERVLEVAAGRVVACEVRGGVRVERHRGRLRIRRPSAPPAR